MSRTMLRFSAVLAVSGGLMSGCSSSENTPAPTPTARVSPPPVTATGAPSSTPAASPTPTARATATPTVPASPRPNIVFIIMDDVGVDQLTAYGLGLRNLANTPNLDAIASAGVRFTNAWSMPECSPSRAAFFTGRYPLRTGVTSALIPNMLPQAQVSPYEVTTPRLLAAAGYKSAMVGKYHLGDKNPAGFCSPQVCGWDYFEGNMEAGPPSIDVQAGQIQANPPDFTCGYDQRPSKTGACYTRAAAVTSCRVQPSGRACLEAGGLFVDHPQCEMTGPDPTDPTNPLHVAIGNGDVILDFGRTNGYYAWPNSKLVGALPPDSTDFDRPSCGAPPLARVYMPIAQTDDGVAWFNEQTGPRMLTASYNNIHTPYQKAQQSLVSFPPDGALQCGELVTDRLLSNNMLEAVDAEIGRLLAELGLATLDQGVIVTSRDQDGNVRIPELDSANTMVVVVGDNGTFAYSVKEPFDPLRSKGTVYQTGVWLPLLVAGPLVKGPTGRGEEALVNFVDLFDLFAEMAGIDARSAVPPAHTLDSLPMLAYLTAPGQPAIRQYNFTQLANGVFESPQNNATRSWPCVLGHVCDDTLFNAQDFCHTNGGVWWGQSDNPDQKVIDAVCPDQAPTCDQAMAGLGSCCAVGAALAKLDQPEAIQIRPIRQFALRDKTYKVVQLEVPDCDASDYDLNAAPPNVLAAGFEFYDLTPTEPDNPVGLDVTNLLCAPGAAGGPPVLCPDGETPCVTPTSCLSVRENAAYTALRAALRQTLASEVFCPGDGNLDKRVTARDLDGVQSFFGDVPSFFDLNFCAADGDSLYACPDAKTNGTDASIVSTRMGSDCVGLCRRSDLNRDEMVDDTDILLLQRATGPCLLCGADLNDDGAVNDADLQLMQTVLGCSYGL